MIDTLRLTAEEANDLLGRARSRRPSCTAPTSRRSTAQRRAERVPRGGGGAERRGHPDRAQGRDLDEGDPHDRGLADARALRPRLRRDRDRAAARPWPVHPGQDEHGRVRDGLLLGELGLRARRATRGIRRASPAARAAARRRRSRRGSRRGRSARTPAARSSSRPRSAATSACARPTGRSPATASSRSPPASTRSGRSRRRCATAPSSTP